MAKRRPRNNSMEDLDAPPPLKADSMQIEGGAQLGETPYTFLLLKGRFEGYVENKRDWLGGKLKKQKRVRFDLGVSLVAFEEMIHHCIEEFS